MDTSIIPKRTLSETLEDLEGLWAAYDHIWDRFAPSDWDRRFGKDWTFRDQPFHMAYFDRVIVNDPLEAGAALPGSERWTTDTIRSLNEWNAREFSHRPSDETPERSRERWQVERDRMRTLLSKHTDDELDTWPYYFHLMGGDGFTLRDAAIGATVHSWGELSELRVRAGRTDVAAPARATNVAVSFYILFLSMLAKTDAVKSSFTYGLSLEGAGGGDWSVRVADGRSEARTGKPASANLAMRMSTDDFNMMMIRQASNPMKGMLTGRIRVKGLTKLPTLGKVFVEPGPDEPLNAIG